MIQTTVGIEGMMCEMCEAHINDAIRRAFDVRSAKASRRKKHCVVVSEEPLDEDALRAAIAGVGYECTSISTEPYRKRSFFGLF